MKLPCVVRDPYQVKKNASSANTGVVCDGMVTWADIAPSILDYAGIKYDKAEFHGRSFIPILNKEKPKGWDEIYGSHTFHEVTMYYPMRVVRQRQYKLIWNLAYPLEFPTANDLWKSKTWQSVLKKDAKKFGKRTMDSFLHRPEFELYDIKKDPGELNNLAGDPKYAKVLEELKEKIKKFQEETKDPWVINWKRKERTLTNSIPM
jgi:N-sulfoglucosamine sulfohydrolase